MNITDSIMESVTTTGGVSINMATGNTPATGFMVSRAGSEVVIDGGLTREHLEQFVDAYREELDYPDAYLGIWTDDATGLVYLDISDNLDNLDTAMMLGSWRGQLAIYDIERGMEVRL